MQNFEKTLEQLLNREISIDDACTQFGQWAEPYAGDMETFKKVSDTLDELYTNHKISDDYQSKILRSVHAISNFPAPSFDDDDDATVIAQPISKPVVDPVINEDEEDEEATIFAVANTDDDKTAILSDDRTVLLSEENDTASDFFIDSGEPEEDDGLLKPGSILKDRFNLVSVLGEGGMGVVYKAIDMLKVEAKDMNPYVAIKVLSEDFKEHPDAFISLQRETSKAQKLAHPNIATVYDFDRDKDTVYMTMEMLEGKPLDEFIKSMPKEGLSEAEAMEIVTGLGEGLAYAHANGLVHSDFKPGNAFVLYDGPVKVIDFGIARAAGGAAQDPAPNHDVGTTGFETSLNPAPTDNTASTTDFDAGTLGALTPAYATIEMFEGKEPAPSDDIYALACVAVLLLTGKHPYKKKTAPKAKQLGLKPPVIEGLTKRQQRALEKGLEFSREDRTETMEEFLDGIRRRKNYTKQIALGTVVGLSLIGGLGYKPITNYYEQQEIDQIIWYANQGSSSRLLQTLRSLQEYSPEKRDSIKNGIKEKALDIYTVKIQEAVNLEEGQYAFNVADQYINEALNYYSDSVVIQDLSLEVSESKEILTKRLNDKYVKQLLEKKLLPEEREDDLTDTLDLLKSFSPDDDAFSDPRIEIAYFNAAKKQIDKNLYETANAYLSTGKKYLTQSHIYDELADRIAINKLNAQVISVQPAYEKEVPSSLNSLDELKPHIKDLTILSLDEKNKSKSYNNFKKVFSNEFKKALNTDPQQAQALLQLFAAALPTASLITYSEQLASNIKPAEVPATEPLVKMHFLDTETDANKLAAHIASIRSSISLYKINALTQFNLDFESSVASLSDEKRPSIIEYYVKLYQPLLIKDSRASAESLLSTARNSFNTDYARVKLQATTENDKRIFRNIAAENRLKDSVTTYNKVIKNTKDTEFIEYAKKEISRMYSTLAESNATEDDHENALTYAREAKKYFSNAHVEKQVVEYQKEIHTKEVARLILTREDEDKIKARKLLRTLKANYVDDYSFIVDKIAYLVNLEILPLAETNLLEAHRLKEHALSVVRSEIIARVSIRGLPKPSKLAIQGKIEVGQKNLTAAKSSLRKASAKNPRHYQVDELRLMLQEQLKIAEDIYKEYEKHFDKEQYKKADKALNRAIAQWKDNPDYNNERSYYDRVMKQVNANAKLCRKDLQGIGKQTRGACNDVILSLKKDAPTMVVVPAMSVKSKPYAIGKYEVSINQLNEYCISSKKCKKITSDDTNLPATDVPREIIEDYTKWLSANTGFEYQIASYEQWRNASAAGGREGNSNYNCRLRLGAKLIKGQNIVPIKSGSVNNWGLINYVGNVDEIVRKNKGYVLAGGNFSDSISDCKISLVKPFSTNGSNIGFRLVRELD